MTPFSYSLHKKRANPFSGFTRFLATRLTAC